MTSNIVSERIFIEKSINNLGINDWSDGDKETEGKEGIKSVDIINHKDRIAIELKDDFSNPYPKPTTCGIVTQNRDLSILSKRYGNHIRSANSKFKNYPGYQTIVLIRSDNIYKSTLEYMIGGLIRVTPKGRIPNTRKNITQSSTHVSVYAFLNTRYNEIYFYKNPKTKIQFDDAGSIFEKMGYTPREIIKEDLTSYDGLSY